MKKSKYKDKHEADLDTYINQLSEDSKPIVTYGDIDQKMKSGAFRRTFLEPLPKWFRIALAIVVTGSILYGLIQNLIVSYTAVR